MKSLKWTVARHPLRSPAFLRLWLGLSISYVGDQFTTIALLWFVLQLIGSGVAISLVLLCFQLPSMITGPLLGVILDRWQPRWVMGIDNCAHGLGRALGNPPGWQAVTSILTAKASDESACPDPFSLASN